MQENWKIRVQMQEMLPDEVDRRLLHALQVDPRASWTDLAPAVGVDAVTLARRWDALSSAGVAWVTGYLERNSQLALIEIECQPLRIPDTVAELEHDPHVVVLDYTSGSRDLLVTVRADDLAALSDYVVQSIGSLPGVRSARTHVVGEVLIDGSSWRLRELDTEEVSRIPPPRPPRSRAARRVPPEVRSAIEHELWRDGRVRIGTIAERHGIAAQRVSDGIATMRQNGELLLRTDVARAVTGWPIYTWYFVEVPARTIEAARTSIAKVPEVRLAVTSSSRYNLILAVWLRQLSDVNRFEAALESALPGARIADRSVVLRIGVHMGRSLGRDERVRVT